MMNILQSTNSSRYGLVYFVSKLLHKRKIWWSLFTHKISWICRYRMWLRWFAW